MREIKFRAWDAENIKWFFWDLYEPFSLFSWKEFKTKELGCIDNEKVGAVGQFTGIKDKNGKEIYEGDLVHYGDDKIGIRIRWSDIQARFVMDRLHEGKWLDSFYNFNEVVAQDLEVVGNIYENTPEILTKAYKNTI